MLKPRASQRKSIIYKTKRWNKLQKKKKNWIKKIINISSFRRATVYHRFFYGFSIIKETETINLAQDLFVLPLSHCCLSRLYGKQGLLKVENHKRSRLPSGHLAADRKTQETTAKVKSKLSSSGHYSLRENEKERKRESESSVRHLWTYRKRK